MNMVSLSGNQEKHVTTGFESVGQVCYVATVVGRFPFCRPHTRCPPPSSRMLQFAIPPPPLPARLLLHHRRRQFHMSCRCEEVHPLPDQRTSVVFTAATCLSWRVSQPLCQCWCDWHTANSVSHDLLSTCRVGFHIVLKEHLDLIF